MGIGTSDGEYFEDAWDHAISSFKEPANAEDLRAGLYKKGWETLPSDLLNNMAIEDAQKNVISPPASRFKEYMQMWDAEKNKVSEEDKLFTKSPKELRELGIKPMADLADAVPANKKADKLVPLTREQILEHHYNEIDKFLPVIQQYKFNSKAWEDWLANAPLSGNIEDRRDEDPIGNLIRDLPTKK